MFSSSLLGALSRPAIKMVQGLNDRAEIVVEESLIVRIGSILGAIKRREIPARAILHRGGHCYIVTVPQELAADSGRLTIYENGRRLPHSQAIHDEISLLGQGRFSHWGEHLLFSSSDNSDPSSNGRRYQIVRES